MSDRRRIIIKRRPIEQRELQPLGQPGEAGQDPLARASTMDQQDYQASAIEERGEVRRVYDEALSKYDELTRRMADIRSMDRTIQRVFHRQDFVELKMVKKKLDELNSRRSEVLAEAGMAEAMLMEAVSELEAEMASHEEELFEKLVEIEALRDAEENGKPVDRGLLARYEQEADSVREEIGRIRERINELQAKIDDMKSLPHKINELTTSDEFMEPLLRELKAKFRDEGRISAAVEKLMQDEAIPKQYAIIYLWKRAVKARVS